jgi:hypothetical protein
MPVEEHEVHSKVKEKAGTKYGCFNRQGYMEAYYAPNRMAGSDGYKPMFRLEAVRIPHTMSRECRYDMSLKDVKCEGCKHRGSGEAYDAKVRAKGA